MNTDKYKTRFQKGHQINKGRHLSEETKRKLSEARKGMKFSEKHRERLSEAHKGQLAWNKGKTWSKETKRKIGLKSKGRISIWRGKKGTNSPNWKGGVTKLDKLERNKFRNTMQKLIFERDNYTCQLCGDRGVALQVDHVQSWAEYIELRFSMDNCRTLCMDCHYLITWGRPKPDNIKTWGHNFRDFGRRESV